MEYTIKHVKDNVPKLKRHKWDDDNNCIKCGLKRKKRALHKDLLSYGHYLYDYYYDGKWISSSQNCL